MNIRYPIYEGVYRILTLHEQTLKDVCIKQTCEINRYICTQLWADI